MAVRRSLRRGYQGIKEAVGETIGTAGEQYGLDFLLTLDKEGKKSLAAS